MQSGGERDIYRYEPRIEVRVVFPRLQEPIGLYCLAAQNCQRRRDERNAKTRHGNGGVANDEPRDSRWDVWFEDIRESGTRLYG